MTRLYVEPMPRSIVEESKVTLIPSHSIPGMGVLELHQPTFPIPCQLYGLRKLRRQVSDGVVGERVHRTVAEKGDVEHGAAGSHLTYEARDDRF